MVHGQKTIKLWKAESYLSLLDIWGTDEDFSFLHRMSNLNILIPIAEPRDMHR
jgi:hypothetical protein